MSSSLHISSWNFQPFHCSQNLLFSDFEWSNLNRNKGRKTCSPLGSLLRETADFSRPSGGGGGGSSSGTSFVLAPRPHLPGSKSPRRECRRRFGSSTAAPDLSALHYCINKHRCLLKNSQEVQMSKMLRREGKLEGGKRERNREKERRKKREIFRVGTQSSLMRSVILAHFIPT